MQVTNHPLPERTPKACVEGRTVGLQRCPDLWLGGVSAAMGLGTWAYDRHWQMGALVGLAAWPILTALYPLPAGIFDWPQVRWTDAIVNGIDLLDLIVGLLSIFS